MTTTEENGAAQQPFDVQAVPEDGHIRVFVRGELDISTAEAFERAIDRAVRHRCHLVIDLRETTFTGVCALNGIARARLRLPTAATVTVRIGCHMQRRILTVCGIDALVLIDDDAPRGTLSGANATHEMPS